MSTSGEYLHKLGKALKFQYDLNSVELVSQDFQIACKDQSTLPNAALLSNFPPLGSPLAPHKRDRYQKITIQPSPDYSSGEEPFPYKRIKLSSNAKSLENVFRRSCDLSDTDEDDKEFEEHIFARNQTIALQSGPGYFGIRRKDIMAVKAYQIDPRAMPKFSRSFESIRTDDLNNLMNKNKQKIAVSMGKMPPRPTAAKLMTSKEYPDIPETRRPKVLSKSFLDKMELTVKKVWGYIIKKDMPKGFKGMQKYKGEMKNNSKRFSQLWVREVQRKANRMQREMKDAIIRGKRLQREMVSYWRKRERETTDMKRRRDREEYESRRKWEEEQESIRQRKRLEYIIKQSDIYSQFMAQKLGIQTTTHHHTPSVQIDEEQAKLEVRNMIIEQRKEMAAYDNQNGNAANPAPPDADLEGLSLNKIDEHIMGNKVIEQPSSFKETLRDYQLKGLRWLDNLQSQGINGILADEMGLGKTIQVIALFAHLIENKGINGPFLVICPATTLYNWQQELERFAPSLRVMSYWGAIRERKAFRRYLNPKRLGSSTIKDQYQVFITSYQIVLADEKVFSRVNWQYLILDEAQAIKSVASLRWKTLLNFRSRNRLLLTGTPIQNSMAELWALLHFIMPKLFDSHDNFQEWFSKDIEAHSLDAGEVNKAQLHRLHAILKPFMLRRIKKDVEYEIGAKTEYELTCDMSNRQKALYSRIRYKLNVTDLFKLTDSKAKVENLMNLMMQFRKVCNHPELFERRPERSPFTNRDFEVKFGPIDSGFNQITQIINSNKSMLSFEIPKLVGELALEENGFARYNIYTPELVGFLKLIGLQFSQVYRFLFVMDIFERAAFLENKVKKIRNITAPEVIHHAEPHKLLNVFTVPVLAPLMQVVCRSQRFQNRVMGQIYSGAAKTLINGWQIRPSYSFQGLGFRNYQIYLREIKIHSPIELPKFGRLIHDSGKLKELDELLMKLLDEGHRVLIFCQMTKMLNILEDYLYFRKIKYFRMDGSTSVAERRVMINEFQTNYSIPAFILSTRAGGLGVNLTGADTVIFYDTDWNPTMDAQAADRVHRIGQTKPVSIYRLITNSTVEERILKRAKQKQTVQSTVYSGSALRADVFRPSEVMELLEDDLDSTNMNTAKFMGGNKKAKKRKILDEKAGNGQEDEIDVTDIVQNEIS